MAASFNGTAFPNGVSSGDVTQTSAVLWTRAVETGRLTFQIATDPSFHHVVKTKKVTVTDPLVPVKVEFDHLKPNKEYFYRAIDADGNVITGTFETSAALGTHEGFHFGVGGDWIGELAPYVSLTNAAMADLDLFIKLGDTIYADLISRNGIFVPDSTTTLPEFQIKHNEVYSSYLGINPWAELQATTPILSMIDDHEVIDNFAGGAPPSSDPRFAAQPGDFINETPLFMTGLKAFDQYNAIENRTYSGTGDDLFDGAPDLYRYNTYGSDAAIIMVDQRSFRDPGLPGGILPADPIAFLIASFDSSRTMLGDVQLERLEQDLLDARDNGITWKFVMFPEPIQNHGPTLFPEDRYEGYAAERNALLKFIDDNHIENVVFVSSDAHWLSVNNLTYQEAPFGPQIASSAIDITTMAVGVIPIAPQIPPFLVGLPPPLGLTPAQLTFYQSLPNAPDPGDNLLLPPDDKDDFVQRILNGAAGLFGYNPIGLSPAQATLLAGDYFVGHSFGWTDFNIEETSGDLLVTTYGVPYYTDADLASNPAGVLARVPTIVNQFEMTPTSNSIIGTAHNDHLSGTNAADVILGAAGNDELKGRDGDDYLDGGKGHDAIFGGNGHDLIFGRDGNDRLDGQDGNDRIEAGTGNDKVSGGDDDDTFVATEGDGNDHYDGDSGTDTLDLSGTAAPATVSLQGSAHSAEIGQDRLSSVENVIGGSGADHITGDRGLNRLDGGPGDDTIDGDRGNDIIIGGLGDDVLIGGAGNDVFVFRPGFGSDTIIGFSAGPGTGDVIQLLGSPVDTFAEVLAATTDLGSDLSIAVGADAITLKNVANLTNLNANDFLFV